MFYGIETSKEWLADYANSTLQSYNRPTIPKTSFFALYTAVKILRHRLRYKNLDVQTVFTIDTPVSRRVAPVPPRGRPIVAICSSEHRSFQRRPSQAQVDALQQIMGKEAKWWISDDTDIDA